MKTRESKKNRHLERKREVEEGKKLDLRKKHKDKNRQMYLIKWCSESE